MEIITTQAYYKLEFTYNPGIVDAIKTTFPKEARRYNSIKKAWYIMPQYRMQLEKFAYQYGFRWATVVQKIEQDFTIPLLPELTLDIPLKMTLRDYQRHGVAYGLIHRKLINADDMGLGKTGQSIATIVGGDIMFQKTGQFPAFPCLVITLASTKYHWLQQWKDWTGRNYAMLLDDNNKRNYHMYIQSNMAKVHIINYDSLEKFFVKSIVKKPNEKFNIGNINFDERIKIYNSVIVDECHKVKDESIKRSKITKGITQGKNFIIGLTGTPCINTPRDVGVQLNIIEQIYKFGGWSNFLERYCAGKAKASNLNELNFNLNRHCFFRRSKQEVAKELPPKSRQVIMCEITNRKEYDAAESNLISYLKQWKDASDAKIESAIRGQVMVQIGILKNISARGKIKDLTDFIDNTIEQGEKVGIFIHLKESATALKSHYHNFVTITGDDNLKERQESIRRFKEDPKCQGIILSIKAAGTGIDGLQYAGSTVAFLELPWHAADSDQAEDRFNRIGQTKPVNCLWFLGKNTIDTHIYNIINTKRGIADTVTGNTDEVKVDFVNEIANLFNIKK